MVEARRVLLLSGRESDRLLLRGWLEELGYLCDCVGIGEGGIRTEVERIQPAVVLLDLDLPSRGGIRWLKEIKELSSERVVLAMVNGDSHLAREALRSGAFDYFERPFCRELFRVTLDRALFHWSLCRGGCDLPLEGLHSFGSIIGRSEAISGIFRKVIKIAQSNANVLIYGESGTGKESLARVIHRYSPRRSNSFIAVDCVAFPETLLESELFGHERGAFTGAQVMRRGLLEYADQGTIFLDEICELAPNLQAKLLRVIQEQEFRRIGGKKLIRVDFRVISATNKEPKEAVRKGVLREDLFYRLNVIPVVLPPLRERREDIPLLVRYFLKKFSQRCREGEKRMEGAALEALMSYAWPGNIRELQNLIEQLVSLSASEEILYTDLPEYIRYSVRDLGLGCVECREGEEDSCLPYHEARRRVLARFDQEYFTELLRRCDGNISRASKVAQVNRRTIYRKLHSRG